MRSQQKYQSKTTVQGADANRSTIFRERAIINVISQSEWSFADEVDSALELVQEFVGFRSLYIDGIWRDRVVSFIHSASEHGKVTREEESKHTVILRS